MLINCINQKIQQNEITYLERISIVEQIPLWISISIN